MSWPELIMCYVTVFIVVTFTIGGLTHENMPDRLFGFFCGFFGGVIAAGGVWLAAFLLTLPYNDRVKTAEVPVRYIYEQIDGDTLVMITSEYQIIKFDSYSDVEKWKDGVKPIRSYFFRKCQIGHDSNYTKIHFPN